MAWMFAWIYVNQVWPITDHIRRMGLSHSPLCHISSIFQPSNESSLCKWHTRFVIVVSVLPPIDLIHSIACTCRQTPLVPFFILANKNTNPLFSWGLHIYHYIRDCNESTQILCQSGSWLNWTYVLVHKTPF